MGKDARRTVLVVSDEVDLFAALRVEVDEVSARLAWCAPAGIGRAAADCLPWPWAVVLDRAVGRLRGEQHLRRLPVIWFTLQPAASAPAGVRLHAAWPALLKDLRGCLGREVGGLRLAPNRGLFDREGRLVLSAPLEGLVGAHPRGLEMAESAVRSTRAVLRRLALPLGLRRTADGVRLEEVA